MDKYLKFIYIRSDNGGVRNFQIHRALVISVLCLFLGLLATSVTLAFKYSGQKTDSRRLAELQRENQALATRVEAFQVTVDELNRRMEANLELQNRARLLAGLDPIDRDVWAVGVGGPEPTLLRSDAGASHHIMADLEENLEQMVRQSRLQLESYEEVVTILDKEKNLRDCTPSIRPVTGGYLSSRFGRRMDPFTGRIAHHTGIDYRARTGTPVISTADGVVTMAKKNDSFGLMIEVNHGFGFKTRYAHLSKMLIKRGARVKRGEIIGMVGNTGRSTGSHLHYEVVFRKTHRNPLNYIIPEGTYYD